jgi:hypothetical protein
VQKPHPPVIVGGNGPTVLERVRAFGDAWMPNFARDAFLDRAAELRANADRPISLQVMGVPNDARIIASLEDAGFDRIVHWVPSAGRSRVEAELDRFEEAIADAHGE